MMVIRCCLTLVGQDKSLLSLSLSVRKDETLTTSTYGMSVLHKHLLTCFQLPSYPNFFSFITKCTLKYFLSNSDKIPYIKYQTVLKKVLKKFIRAFLHLKNIVF